MTDPYREAEATLGRLREEFQAGRISQQEFSDSLRRLRIKDDDGRFWAIGSQSGRWYVHEGGRWAEARPPSQLERKAVCVACGFENDLEADSCARCGGRRARGAPEGPGAVPVPDGPDAAPAAAETVIRALDLKSFAAFFGVLGLFAGFVLGLLAGVTGLFAGFLERLPAFFAEHRGDLVGGVSGSVVGALLGLLAGGAAGALLAAVSNGVLSLVGGIRFRRS
ncbi:MAG TPA: hypothetical protein PLP83_01765 [Candidatus Aminicenantes bacterium]|nr:hypothetical protein [Candidatus Aminicenantes bacterium]